eukprot:TRINITY_DN4674_c0_g2_i1.p1 TRINITY_DN4674_c0_g2~~TRINITY_DN4674_c0_g2_i1.p1  ORF type:complete len:556 (+),score=95.47 TRINITY_DN4674_c0_g2_i1:93-1670(+)
MSTMDIAPKTQFSYGSLGEGFEDTSKMDMFRSIPVDIDRYMYLRDLQATAPDQFFKLLMRNTEEILPYIYTPTVGEACQKYHKLPIVTRGLYITLSDRGNILQKLQQWHNQDVRVIVVTDGERILGLGDQGAGGMGIAEGKILLYTAAAGVHPAYCLPICLDVGTNTESLLNDPQYKGIRQNRPKGEEYYSFLDEFMKATKTWKEHVLVQFEDFGNHNAFNLLNTYRNDNCVFNDDIQGTACITLAGILSALRATKWELKDQVVLFNGAGEAAAGIAELISMALQKKLGITREEARKHCYFMDSKGLVCAERQDKLPAHKVPFAHDVPYQKDLLSAVQQLRPTILIGVSTIPDSFTQEVVQTMMTYCDRPIIFPLSNPTSKSECTFQQAYEWTDGKVLFASGSPFDPIQAGNVTIFPAQANNAYIFPAVGHAAVLAKGKSITDDVFLVAAETLSKMTNLQELQMGRLFPPFDKIKDVSVTLIGAVMKFMVDNGLGSKPVEIVADDYTSYALDHWWTLEKGVSAKL